MLRNDNNLRKKKNPKKHKPFDIIRIFRNVFFFRLMKIKIDVCTEVESLYILYTSLRFERD